MSRIRLEVSKELEDIMPLFLDTVSKNISSIHDALQSGDFETVRTLGHRMKGAGGGYGFDRVTELGREIEIAAKRKQRGSLPLSQRRAFTTDGEHRYRLCR